MINLSQIIVIVAWLAVPVSIWGIIYFSARIIIKIRVRRDLGDMPSADDLHKWYEQNNFIITGKHSPTRDKLPAGKKSTL